MKRKILSSGIILTPSVMHSDTSGRSSMHHRKEKTLSAAASSAKASEYTRYIYIAKLLNISFLSHTPATRIFCLCSRRKSSRIFSNNLVCFHGKTFNWISRLNRSELNLTFIPLV